MNAVREDLVTRIDRLGEELERPPTRSERRAGWVPEARAAVAQSLAETRARLLDERTLDPRDLPSAAEALRSLDAWGIDVAAPDPLVRDLLGLIDDLRKAR
jgi:hypothetical protein